jgi:hypothetical protein
VTTTTTTPISVTFTGYSPSKALKSTPPPTPTGGNSSSNTFQGAGGSFSSTPSAFEDLISLAFSEAYFVVDQILFGITPNSGLHSAIATYQSLIQSNPMDSTLLGEALILLVQLDIFSHLSGTATS